MIKIIFLLVLLVAFPTNTFATQDIEIEKFLETISDYSTEIFPELENENVLTEVIEGKVTEPVTLWNRIVNFFFGELKISINIVSKILITTIFCSMLKNLGPQKENGVKEIAFYVAYLVIVGLIINSYINIGDICKASIEKLKDFVNILVPLILGLMIANGTIVSAGVMKPVLLLMITIINSLVTQIILPITFMSLVINIASNASESINISKLPQMLQKFSINFLKCLLAIFIGVLSLEGTLSANVDGFTAKTAKAIVSTTIPVVGKALSDAADSVVGAASITKNAIGIVGILVIVAIILEPIIKTFSLMIIFNISAALIEPIADKRISTCMTITADAIKTLFALLATISVIFILAISLMLKVSNFSIMY